MRKEGRWQCGRERERCFWDKFYNRLWLWLGYAISQYTSICSAVAFYLTIKNSLICYSSSLLFPIPSLIPSPKVPLSHSLSSTLPSTPSSPPILLLSLSYSCSNSPLLHSLNVIIYTYSLYYSHSNPLFLNYYSITLSLLITYYPIFLYIIFNLTIKSIIRIFPFYFLILSNH